MVRRLFISLASLSEVFMMKLVCALHASACIIASVLCIPEIKINAIFGVAKKKRTACIISYLKTN
jgi:hypothetical protein